MFEADEIVNHLNKSGYSCDKETLAEQEVIVVKLDIGDRVVELVYILTDEITNLPAFILANPSDFGHLAHVTIFEYHGVEFGSICVNDRDSVSVNFALPLLAIESSLERHIALLTKAITDPAWNNSELLREFKTCWQNCCVANNFPILLTAEIGELEEIDVFRPLSNAKIGINSYYLAQSKDTELSPNAKVNWPSSEKRASAGKAVVIPLDQLDPAPMRADGVTKWYLNTLSSLSSSTIEDIKRKYGNWKTREYWVIFNAPTPSGKVWFGVAFQSDKKRSLPITEEQLSKWKVEATEVMLFNKDNVLPRGGANLNLAEKNVALIGAGSVGSELAHKLSATGITQLDIFDPDIYGIENLQRHILPERFLQAPKSFALKQVLMSQFLWSKVRCFGDSLLDLRQISLLKSYDLIVIAIGSPTHERLFKEYLLENNINVPVINTWLEGFGVGGHAVLDMPESKGCLLCSYVCPDTLLRGLGSNLNFIEPNQNITINLSGCGEQFISYGAICSAQTALIAADLAIKVLEGKIQSSSKVSWKGGEHDAVANGISLTNRYYQFNKSLQLLPLYHEDCDVCN